MQAWLNGQLVPQEQVTVPVLSHSFCRGSAIFEVLDVVSTARGPAIFLADAHVDRLLRSADLLHIPLRIPREVLLAGLCDTVRANGLACGVIKCLAYYSQPEFSLMPHDPRVDVAIFCADLQTACHADEQTLARPASACVVSIRRSKPNAGAIHAKAAGHYVSAMLSRREALCNGCDDALLLDDAGFLAEGPVSNVFLVSGGVVRTPTLANVLPGITRDTVLKIVQDLGIPGEETDIPAAAIARAEEAFYTGTSIHVRPIRAIDGRPVGPVCPGPITRRIQQAFDGACTGGDERYVHWLHYTGGAAIERTVVP